MISTLRVSTDLENRVTEMLRGNLDEDTLRAARLKIQRETDCTGPEAYDYVNALIEKLKTDGHSTSKDPLPDVPAVMKSKRQWVRWKLEPGENGKPTKVPYQTSGKKASNADPSTWTDYRTAVTGATINREQGVGFMFADGFAGIDLDGCRNPKTGEITPWADDIIQSIDNVYVEVSPSGTGLHIFVLGKVPGADKKFNLNPAIGYGKAAIEIYDERRYFTATGNSYFEEPGDVIACDLTGVYQKFHELRRDNPVPRDERVEQGDAGEPTQAKWHGLLHCSKYDIFKRGEILSQLPFVIDNRIGQLEYPSQSEADLAFCTILAIMHDGDADKIWDEYCDSSMVREKWLNREGDFRRLTIVKAIESAKKFENRKQSHELTATVVEQVSHKDLEVREVAEPEKVLPLALPNSALTSSVFGDLFDQVFALNGWTMEFALPALATAGSVLVPQQAEGLIEPPHTTLYTALIGGVNVGKSQVTEWAAKAVGIYNELRSAQYAQSKFGSAEQMWKFLHKYSTQGTANTLNPFRDAVLVNLDEWSHLMSKAGIPDSTFASALTTGFYSRRTTVTLGGQGGGRDILIPFPFSMIGGVVDDQFGHSFNSATTGGLYSRMLFGLAPEGFQWAYRPFPHEHAFFQSKGTLDLKPVAVSINPNVWELTNGWKKNDPTLDRIPEIVTRVATIFASIDGRRILEAKDVEKMWPLVTYQKAVRSIYRPNPGKNPDAVYANVALNWINTHAEQWRTIKELKDGTNYFRRELGPRACYYALMALAQNHDIEFWVSEVGGGGNLNDLPADYQGKRPKIGMGLVRKALG